MCAFGCNLFFVREKRSQRKKAKMTYTEVIAKGLKVDLATAAKIQNFINCWFDFRWSSSSTNQIVKIAKEAYAMMQNPNYAEMTKTAELLGAN
jgi:hypothetical protein